MSEQSLKFRAAKDSLVSSLFELSKASSQTASCVVDFYNCIGENDEELKSEAFATLVEALSKLSGGASQLNGVADELTGTKTVVQKNAKKNAEVGLLKKVELKKRVEKDPFAPKKPLTVFFAYSAYIRDSLIDDRKKTGLSPLTSIEITQEISKRWKTLSDEEKSKWKQAYNAELENYQKRKTEYLEAKKNGTFQAADDFTNNAPVPIPIDIGATSQAIEDVVLADIKDTVEDEADEDEEASEKVASGSKRSHSSTDGEKKKKKKKSKKEKKTSTD